MKGRLILVEDDEYLREELSSALAGEGFVVISACNGVQAINELSSGANIFDAIVTDINLGRGPDGWEVASKARIFFPAIHTVYMSGEGLHEWSTKGMANSAIVSKPFRLSQLLTAISSSAA